MTHVELTVRGASLRRADRPSPAPLAADGETRADAAPRQRCKLRKLVIKPCLACTANCPTCAGRHELHQFIRRERTLSLEQWRGILAEARDLGVRELDISGGEPTLYPHLAELIRIGRGYGWQIGLNTNGSLINEPRARDLLAAGLNTAHVSIYSADAATHNAMRRSRNLWQKATNAVCILRDLESAYPQFRVKTQTLLCRENFRTLPELLALHRDIGSHEIALAYLEGDFERKYLLTQAEIRELRTDVVPRALRFCEQLESPARERAQAVLQGLYSEDVLSLKQWADGEYRPTSQSQPACRRPSEFTILLANGDVHPCNMIEYTHEPVMGNLFENTLTELWHSSQWDEFRARGFDQCRWCPINLYLSVPL